MQKKGRVAKVSDIIEPIIDFINSRYYGHVRRTDVKNRSRVGYTVHCVGDYFHISKRYINHAASTDDTSIIIHSGDPNLYEQIERFIKIAENNSDNELEMISNDVVDIVRSCSSQYMIIITGSYNSVRLSKYDGYFMCCQKTNTMLYYKENNIIHNRVLNMKTEKPDWKAAVAYFVRSVERCRVGCEI